MTADSVGLISNKYTMQTIEQL